MKEAFEKVLCASCGWSSRRKTGQIVICPECGKVAGFVVDKPFTGRTLRNNPRSK